MFSVVFIVRDEEHTLPEAITSLGDVPEIVVCDTGSSDRTVEVATSLGARVCLFAWSDDFSAARAFAQQHAAHEWIVRFDADERLAVETGAAATWLRDAVRLGQDRGASMVCVRRYYAPGREHWFPRCYRRSAWRWKYPVHELLVSATGRRVPVVAAHGATVRHVRQERPRNYRRILLAALEPHPADPYLLFYMGEACWQEGDWAAAVGWLSRYIKSEGGYRWHRSEAFLLRGRAYMMLREHELALEDFESASVINGPRAEPMLAAAELCLSLGDPQCARVYAERGRRTELPMEIQMFGEPDAPYVTDRRAYAQEPWLRILERCKESHPAKTGHSGKPG